MLRLLQPSLVLLALALAFSQALTSVAADANPVLIGSEAEDPKAKGFHDSEAVPREPMEVLCEDCFPCSYAHSIGETVYNLDSMHDCEQACYFDSECHFFAYRGSHEDAGLIFSADIDPSNGMKKRVHKSECELFSKCQKDASRAMDWTVMHKIDAGVLGALSVSSSCTLEPAFRPMLVNYLADCPGVSTASATMKAHVDVWVNDVMYFASAKGEFTVPNMMYHDVPTVTTVETLKDVLLSEKEQLQACES